MAMAQESTLIRRIRRLRSARNASGEVRPAAEAEAAGRDLSGEDAEAETQDRAPIDSGERGSGGVIRDIPCDQCGSEQFLTLFEKASSMGEVFHVVRCMHCDLVQVNPQPDAEAVQPYYAESYFQRRTDRGYDNYFSDRLKAQITRVYGQNLRDLGFYEFEENLLAESWIYRCLGDDIAPDDAEYTPRALDIGCAAGYFVEYLRDRGWNAEGVELSEAAASFGIEQLGLPILVDDFLTCNELPEGAYDFVTLWASIEHMHSPRAVLERSHALLKPGGRMVLTTCRFGVLASLQGPDWRFMNVPEHLYFFDLAGLKDLAESCGFDVAASVTYGSGLTGKVHASPLYRLAKRIADPLVKRLGQGDMMALHLRKVV